MLSRVADSLFWMGRYIERADAMARLVDVHLQMLFDLSQEDALRLRADWGAIIRCLALDPDFKKTGAARDMESVIEFLVWSQANHSSIVNCVRSARENARAVREQIPTEMWKQLNRFYWWITSKESRQIYARNPHDFYDFVKSETMLFHGTAHTTMRHGEAWDFIQLGVFIERADTATRALDEKFHLLGVKHELLQSWIVLRLCCAVQAFQQTYHSDVTPFKVAELLLLDSSFPRSVAFCMHQTNDALRRITGAREGSYSNEADKISGRLCASLTFSSIEDYWGPGLHRAMDQLQGQINTLSAAINACFIDRKSPVPEQTSATAPAQ